MSMNNPAGTPATGDGQPTGATQPTSQGPNDPINPPANGGQSGQPATGEPAEGQQDRAQRNRDEALARMAAERDEARRLLEEEKRKTLPEDERKRLQEADERDKRSQAALQKMALKYEVAAKAPGLGIVDPEAAVLFLEQSGKVTVSEDLTVTGVDQALKDLIKEKPWLAKKEVPNIDAGAGSGGSRAGGKPTMNDIIRDKARGIKA